MEVPRPDNPVCKARHHHRLQADYPRTCLDRDKSAALDRGIYGHFRRYRGYPDRRRSAVFVLFIGQYPVGLFFKLP